MLSSVAATWSHSVHSSSLVVIVLSSLSSFVKTTNFQTHNRIIFERPLILSSSLIFLSLTEFHICKFFLVGYFLRGPLKTCFHPIGSYWNCSYSRCVDLVSVRTGPCAGNIVGFYYFESQLCRSRLLECRAAKATFGNCSGKRASVTGIGYGQTWCVGPGSNAAVTAVVAMAAAVRITLREIPTTDTSQMARWVTATADLISCFQEYSIF